ncbi:MAG: Radical SAM protein [archaeon GW2011_AR9]|nr:MAG: Radical SAM protein [archaeon GW2011_AR9]MBS3120383.1 radical SAM protein [Candidatus Woesearchaeota archaeon]HIG93137.1 radical SAM protein [Candidatus Woesearchaeota archaeon]HIH13150.1 radical SAM protein [Candidatus Woesearchaeota archaeon]
MSTSSHSDDAEALLGKAQEAYLAHFPPTVSFERAVFFSWGCTIGDCQFCYMSTQPDSKKPTETKRSNASILAEFILAKHLGWDIGFFTGGIGVLKPDELEFLLKAIFQITNEKIWLSVGPVSKPLLQRYLPYIRGVVGSTETISPILHKKVCPSKPLAPYERMFEAAKELNLERAMTFIVGLGETKDDLPLLIEFIQKYAIHKIHIYSLIPEKGTAYEHATIPSKEEQAWWIAQLRIAFPILNIQCGIWEDRVDRVSYLLNAGANSISKFKGLKLFGTPLAGQIEEQAIRAGRKFQGTLTKFPHINWDAEVERLSLEGELKEYIKKALHNYLHQMKKNVETLKNRESAPIAAQ